MVTRLALLCALVLGSSCASHLDQSTTGDARPECTSAIPVALRKLHERAQRTDTDALVIWHQGNVVMEDYFGRPEGAIETMSITKSIVSLAIGKLLDDGKLKSLDTPVYEFFPEWNQGNKRRITLRHLLNHTSGIQTDDYDQESFQGPDYVRLGLAAELVSKPGASFQYNNKAVNVLAGIVHAAAGQTLDSYVTEQFFAPLGITDFRWKYDQAGNPRVMSGLELHARDLLQVGQLIADGGRWHGRQLISERWLGEMGSPSQGYQPNYGLLWWLPSRNASAWARLWHRVIPNWAPEPFYPTRDGYSAEGSLGQYLVVYPAKRLVAVRLRRVRAGAFEAPIDYMFSNFPRLVAELKPRPGQSNLHPVCGQFRRIDPPTTASSR